MFGINYLLRVYHIPELIDGIFKIFAVIIARNVALRCRLGFRYLTHHLQTGTYAISKSIFSKNRLGVCSIKNLICEHLIAASVNIICESFNTPSTQFYHLMSSLAQEESRSISENTTWGKRKTFADGKCSVAYSHFLGYDKDFKINEEEAHTVRLIYKLFLSGYSYYAITKELERRHRITPFGAEHWCISTVKSVLTNEKYKGDALLQKVFTVDFLTKKIKVNEGEVPQYYVEGHHEAIIEPEIYERVQAEIQARYSTGKKFSGISIFSSKIRCGECGNWYGTKVWHSNDKYRRVVYQCTHKYKDGCVCGTPHFSEKEIEDLFLAVLDKLHGAKKKVIENLEILRRTAADPAALTAERDALRSEASKVEEKLRALINRNARTVADQTAYTEEYNAIVETNDYKAKLARIEEISSEITKMRARGTQIAYFIDQLKNMQECPVSFDPDLWCGLVENVTIFAKDNIVFTLAGGLEVAVG